ncbi:MAG TPA: GNAT family N-acetyltransferase [Rhizomicrobium sp.]|jgi:GNAT superfamily N-acetyltransferase
MELEIEVAPDVVINRVDGKLHADALNSMQRACLPSDKPANVTRGRWWIAYDGDKPVGFIGLHPSSYRDAAYLVRLGVLPSHRRLGLSKRLIRVACAHVKRLGYQRVLSDTSNNPASSNALIGCGFRLFAPLKPWGLKTSIYFQKEFT